MLKSKRIIAGYGFCAILFLGNSTSAFCQSPSSQIEVQEDHQIKKLVPGFPAIPMPQSAVLDKSSKKKMGQLEGMAAYYQSSLGVVENIKFFRSELPMAGWQILTEAKELYSPNEEFIECVRQGVRLNISVEHEDGQTEIAVEFPVRTVTQ